MIPAFAPICYECRRYKGPDWSCEAFTRIPEGVLMSTQDHTKPIDGDNGLQFEPINPKKVGAFTHNPLLKGLTKYDPNEPRDERGRWTTGGAGPNQPTGPKGTHPEGYSDQAVLSGGKIYTSNVEDAVKALSEDRDVVLDQPRQVSTLLDRLAQVAREMERDGAKAKNFDLCRVSVKGSNLFCVESKGIPRIKMPQLKGIPTPGSRADALARDVRGEVDVSAQFRNYLDKKGYKITDTDEAAAYLRASQNELNGVKVAGIANAIRNNKLDEARLFVSRDNYVVDGHHRWAATVAVDLDDNHPGDLRMPIARVNMSIIQLLREANNFARHWGIPQAAVKRRVRVRALSFREAME